MTAHAESVNNSNGGRVNQKEAAMRGSAIVDIDANKPQVSMDADDISKLSKEDLARLRKTDPFMYLSIPEKRLSYYMMDDEDSADEDAAATSPKDDRNNHRESFPRDLPSRASKDGKIS